MKRLSVKVWEYTNANGEKKWEYITFGNLVQTENGEAIAVKSQFKNFLKQLFWDDRSGRINIYDSEWSNNSQQNTQQKDENLPF